LATSLTPDVKIDDWTQSRDTEPEPDAPARAEWLWPLMGLVLLGAFLSFVVDDYPLRTIIAGS
jgi:MYXO-CTERM domain-containing protein